jgi:hypothetical protein
VAGVPRGAAENGESGVGEALPVEAIGRWDDESPYGQAPLLEGREVCIKAGACSVST